MEGGEFSTAPARKAYKGKKGRDHRKRGGPTKSRKDDTSTKPIDPRRERDVEEGEGQRVAEQQQQVESLTRDGVDYNQVDRDLDLEELISQALSDRWYAAGAAATSTSAEQRWGFVWGESSDGFSLDALQFDTSTRDLFDLDLGALEYALAQLPAEKLVRGLDERMVPEMGAPPHKPARPRKPRAKGGQGAADQPNHKAKSVVKVQGQNQEDEDLEELLSFDNRGESEQDVTAQVSGLGLNDEDDELDALLDM
ncbi:hypothetical protein A3770_02p12510 [Chloropicon primus]|uniref:Uncharacterized protein n=1 Tax=Chloropicon primus TaxID=1764295 RepID=A0A5B8ME77_9CHLO|nr:hypothetical protein A3770_02p12510 [Chloropicon primus]|eukprot:QDZ18733.1 hypothetical protein A3770_02p12510 [Chloropicon primus]